MTTYVTTQSGGTYRVVPTPDYMVVGEGDVVAVSPRTGYTVVVREADRAARYALTPVDVYTVDTVVMEVDGRPSVMGVRGTRLCAGRMGR